ncbi:MAG: NAD(P)/FAD-dependent oxidoreductase, partial [Cyclobacteriaceae bacterium]
MDISKKYEVIIVGGSYAGLSSAMALGRSLRSVLIVDSGQPCNRQTPYSHNFLTRDGQTPDDIAEIALSQVLNYDTVAHLQDKVASVTRSNSGFEVRTNAGKVLNGRKILFATGVKDIMPAIKGFAECWGISVLHCPYCHGYEVAGKALGIIANGDIAFDLCKLIRHWSDKLTLFTNGKSELTDDQYDMIGKLNIEIVEKEIAELKHTNGNLDRLTFTDGSETELAAVFARVGFEHHCDIPVQLGCKVTEQGYI